jgi:hypothetical protein
MKICEVHVLRIEIFYSLNKLFFKIEFLEYLLARSYFFVGILKKIDSVIKIYFLVITITPKLFLVNKCICS